MDGGSTDKNRMESNMFYMLNIFDKLVSLEIKYYRIAKLLIFQIQKKIPNMLLIENQDIFHCFTDYKGECSSSYQLNKQY